jgi:hypothetical protein
MGGFVRTQHVCTYLHVDDDDYDHNNNVIVIIIVDSIEKHLQQVVGFSGFGLSHVQTLNLKLLQQVVDMERQLNTAVMRKNLFSAVSHFSKVLSI